MALPNLPSQSEKHCRYCGCTSDSDFCKANIPNPFLTNRLWDKKFFYRCTRRAGHSGDHIACGGQGYHAIATIKAKKQPKNGKKEVKR